MKKEDKIPAGWKIENIPRMVFTAAAELDVSKTLTSFPKGIP